MSTFGQFIQQCSLGIWNKTTVENLIAALSDSEVPASSKTVAHILLKVLPLSHQRLFKENKTTLADWIISESSQITPDRTREDKLAVEDILKTLYRLKDVDFPGKQGREFVDALKKFALEGETERQGRRATAVLLKMKLRNVYADDLVTVFHSKRVLLSIGNCSISYF